MDSKRLHRHRPGGQAVPPHDVRAWGVPGAMLVLAALLQIGDANEAAFLWINQLAVHGELFWRAATVMGDGLVVFALALPLVGRRPDIVWALIVAAVLATLWVHGLKPAVDVPRPPAVLALDVFNTIGPRHSAANSFPSGHAAAIMTLAATLILIAQRRIWFLVLFPVAVLIGLSRVVVGVHWPLDVVAGIFGAWLAAVVAIHVAQRWRWGLRLGPQRGIAFLLMLCALVLPWHNAGHPEVQWLQAIIAVGVLGAAAPALWRLFFVTRTGDRVTEGA
jgi:membrane-associated phospholipid phosphatase